MSGIAGVICLADDTTVPERLTQQLTTALRPRGPDRTLYWTASGIGLGHCLLNTTGKSSAQDQLQVTRDHDLVIVFDGRLDNREELLLSLDPFPATSSDQSDAEIILNAYRAWSETCAQRLLGDFAFAIWDVKRATLYCARDQLGARQFYYVSTDHYFAFASDDEALLCIPGVTAAPYEPLIGNFLDRGAFERDPGQPWLRDVRSLSPGHFLDVSPEGPGETKAYWQHELGNEAHYANDRECQEAFTEVFQQAVQSRLRDAGSSAAIVSGGMDSAALTAMLQRSSDDLPGNKFHAYSWLTDNPEDSLESRCIQSMTRPDNIQVHTARLPSLSGVIEQADLHAVAWSRPHPVDNSILLVGSLCHAARCNGHPVLLHGVSGDVVNGYEPRYIAPLLRTGQWQRAWQESNAASQNHTYLKRYSPRQLLWMNMLTAFAPAGGKKARRWIRAHTSRPSPVNDLLRPEFTDRLSQVSPAQTKVQASSMDIALQQRANYAASLFGPSGVLLGLSAYHGTAARLGVDMRDPWADKRVLEFYLHLPLDQKVRFGWTKYLARSTFEQDVGSNIVWRNDKEHFGWRCVDRLMDDSDAFVDYTLNDELHFLDDYVDTTRILHRYARYREDKQHREHEEKKFFYDIVTLTHWLKRVSGP